MITSQVKIACSQCGQVITFDIRDIEVVSDGVIAKGGIRCSFCQHVNTFSNQTHQLTGEKMDMLVPKE